MSIPVTLKIVPDIQPQVILRCAQIDSEVEQLLALLCVQNRRIATIANGETLLLAHTEVLYCESVEGKVFVYTQGKVLPTSSSLAQLEEAFAQAGFFVAAKAWW